MIILCIKEYAVIPSYAIEHWARLSTPGAHGGRAAWKVVCERDVRKSATSSPWLIKMPAVITYSDTYFPSSSRS